MEEKPWKVTIEYNNSTIPTKIKTQGETLEKTLEMALAYIEDELNQSVKLQYEKQPA